MCLGGGVCVGEGTKLLVCNVTARGERNSPQSRKDRDVVGYDELSVWENETAYFTPTTTLGISHCPWRKSISFSGS